MNGWLIGRYVNNVGPQHQFYVPAGILNDHGPNTLAIAVWGLDGASGGLPQVSLVAARQPGRRGPGGAGVQPRLLARGLRPAVAPQPTLAAISSSALADGPFTVQATLRNPDRPPLPGTSLSLSAPAGWTVTPSGATSAGTVAPGRSADPVVPGHPARLRAVARRGQPAGHGQVRRGGAEARRR